MNTSPEHIKKIYISIVVPFYNEEEGLEMVCEEILSVASKYFDTPWELLMVNDGSSDKTPSLIDTIAQNNSNCRAIHLNSNSGQSAALEAGFSMVRGEIIATLDGDGQNDPADLPGLIDKMTQLNVDML